MLAERFLRLASKAVCGVRIFAGNASDKIS
jgi:hypothetical protein